jgi:hypothetical protein
MAKIEDFSPKRRLRIKIDDIWALKKSNTLITTLTPVVIYVDRNELRPVCPQGWTLSPRGNVLPFVHPQAFFIFCSLGLFWGQFSCGKKLSLQLSDWWLGAYLKGLTFPRDLQQRGTLGGR